MEWNSITDFHLERAFIQTIIGAGYRLLRLKGLIFEPILINHFPELRS